MIIVSYKHILVSMDKLFLEQHKSMNQELHILFCSNVLNCKPSHNYHAIWSMQNLMEFLLRPWLETTEFSNSHCLTIGNRRFLQVCQELHIFLNPSRKKGIAGPRCTHDAFGKSPTFSPPPPKKKKGSQSPEFLKAFGYVTVGGMSKPL